MVARPQRDPQETAHCVRNIRCEYGGSCIGGTGRPLSVRPHEYRYNLKENLLEKLQFAQHAYEEDHRVKLGYWKLKVTTGIGKTRNRPMWRV
jgi:hypothetical protein